MSSRALLSPAGSSPTQNTSKGVGVSLSEEAAKIKNPTLFSNTALPTPVASSQVDMEPQSKLSPERSNETDLVRLIHRIDIPRESQSIKSSSDDDIQVSIPRKLFRRRKRNDLGLDANLSDASSSVKSAKPDNDALEIGLNSKDGDANELIKLVISSSEDESDHLEKVAQMMSNQPSPTTPTTPPVSVPSSSRHARLRREPSNQKSDWLSEKSQSKRQIESPSKSNRKLKPRRELTVNTTPRSEAPKPRRSTRSSTMDQYQIEPPVPLNIDHADSAHEDVAWTGSDKASIPLVESSSDDDSEIVKQPRSSRRAKPQVKPPPLADSYERNSSSDEVVTPVRRMRSTKLAEASHSKSSENVENDSADDLREDLADLKDTEVRSQRTRGLQRTPKKTKIQQQLEFLRQRRSGQNGQNPVEISSASEDPTTSQLTRRHSRRASTEADSSEQTQESEEDDDQQLVRADEDLDQYDDDFVTEDDDGPLGAPQGLDQMPFEFTRHAHKKPVQHFKDVVEWMVHNKLNPAFPRDDPVYQIAVYKLDDEVKGTAGSKFMSAVWRPDFLAALKERPDIAYLETQGIGEHCAACNRSNHPAKYQLVFSGRAYDRKSLEDVSDDEDEDDGNPDQNETWGYNPKTFYVGRTCCANAETAHALHHWRYVVNQWVLDWLRRNGYMTSQKIVERERWSTNKRSEYANGIVDNMQSNGEMKTLYKEFKENLQAAREVKVRRIYWIVHTDTVLT